ncbi:MAG: dihydrofolate reductase family protein [Bellilinea sp.]
MRKIIQFNMMTLDGFFEGPNQDINWHNVDDEFNEFAIEQLESTDALIFGRATYELMAGYWPTPEAIATDPVVAGWMNKLPKFVFSKTLPKTEWHNTTLIKGDAAPELNILKQQPGKDLFIFGSADLSETFFRYGLIDEIRVMVNPLILGGGTTLFKPRRQKIPLILLKVKTFQNGNVLLFYRVERRSM